MPDVVQFAIVTLTAVAAVVMLVRPYVRPRRDAGPCAACPSGQKARPVRTEPDVRPLRVVRR